MQNIVRNLSLSRSRARLGKLIIDTITLDEVKAAAPPPEENLELVYGDILSADDFLLLKRVATQGYTLMEMADELGISVEACRKRVRRAKERLRNFLEKNQK